MQAQPQSNLASRISAPPTPLPASLHPNPRPSPHPPAPAAAAPLVPETSGLAHDAGNLLAALALYCDLLKVPGVLRPEHQHYASELHLISNRSAALIRRLLAAPALHDPAWVGPDPATVRPSRIFRSRIARSPDSPPNSASSPTTANHAATLLSLAPVLERIAAGAATVTVTCPSSLPPLAFPAEIIERITVNLVRNAAEAIRRDQDPQSSIPFTPLGEIHVTLGVTGDRLQLTVEDNGPGMSPMHVEAYLHPEPLPLGASRGLGHLIVHELANTTDGRLSIRVRPGHGTVFCLKWPLRNHPPAEPRPSAVPHNP